MSYCNALRKCNPAFRRRLSVDAPILESEAAHVLLYISRHARLLHIAVGSYGAGAAKHEAAEQTRSMIVQFATNERPLTVVGTTAAADTEQPPTAQFSVCPIGRVRKTKEKTEIILVRGPHPRRPCRHVRASILPIHGRLLRFEVRGPPFKENALTCTI